MQKQYTLINGRFIEAANAELHITDLSIQRGFGIFDFFKTLNGRPIFLDDHLDRFYFSAEQMRLDPGYTRPELKLMLWELMQLNQMPQSGIRITLTGGYSADMYTIGKPNIIITQSPLTINDLYHAPPLQLVTYEHQRQLPQVKTIDYLMAIWLQPHIRQQQADDVLYFNNQSLTECPRSNIFLVDGQGNIATPKNNILRGIIRTRLLQHFSGEFNMVERDIATEEILTASEIFVTSSTRNVLPVTSVDGRLVGNGKTGELTTLLAQKLQLMINEEAALPVPI